MPILAANTLLVPECGWRGGWGRRPGNLQPRNSMWSVSLKPSKPSATGSMRPAKGRQQTKDNKQGRGPAREPPEGASSRCQLGAEADRDVGATRATRPARTSLQREFSRLKGDTYLRSPNGLCQKQLFTCCGYELCRTACKWPQRAGLCSCHWPAL